MVCTDGSTAASKVAAARRDAAKYTMHTTDRRLYQDGVEAAGSWSLA
ncbi:MAG: hypothetical protein WC708_07400 [Lentisphaeria bacterium]